MYQQICRRSQQILNSTKRSTTKTLQIEFTSDQQSNIQQCSNLFFRPTPGGSRQVVYQAGKTILSRSLYRSHVLTTFFGPVLGAMMKQVCWHSRRSKAYRGLPEARGQSEAHGDSNLYTMGVRPCVTAKLPVLGPWFWNLILLNLAAASCYLHGGRFWQQQVPSPLWWRNLLQVLMRELNHFKQQRKALRQASQLCCFGLQMQFVTVF